MEEKTYEKVSEGEAKVVIVSTTEKVVDLYQLKQRKAELEGQIDERRRNWLAQKTFELEQIQTVVDKEIAGWQQELDEVTAEITGAEQAGVKEVAPIEKPIVEEVVK